MMSRLMMSALYLARLVVVGGGAAEQMLVPGVQAWCVVGRNGARAGCEGWAGCGCAGW